MKEDLFNLILESATEYNLCVEGLTENVNRLALDGFVSMVARFNTLYYPNGNGLVYIVGLY